MTTDTIAEQVATMRAGMAAQPPNEVMGAFVREQADLAARGMPSGVADAGAGVAYADLLDAHGTPTTLYGVADGRPAVIVFYRRRLVPVLQPGPPRLPGPAAADAHRTRRGLDRRQPPVTGRIVEHPTEERTDLPGDVRSRQHCGRSLGVLSASSDEARAAQLQLGLDLTTVNADGTTAIPTPTTVIVDGNHVIRWIDVHPDYSTRSEPAAILSAVDAAGL